MKIMTNIVAIIIAMIVAGAGTYWWLQGNVTPNTGKPSTAESASRAVTVVTTKVVAQDINEQLPSVGTLLANEAVTITTEVSGRVSQILFTEGQTIKKGEVLLKLDASSVQAELAQAQANLQLAKATYHRMSSLGKNGYVSPQALEEAQNSLQVMQANAQLLQTKLDKYTLKAPFDGVVGLRQVSLGSLLKEGDVVTTLVDFSRLKVEFSVPEIQFQSIKQGQSVRLMIDAFPEQVYSASVYAFEPSVDPTVKSIMVRAWLDNKATDIRPGMYARVFLQQSNVSSQLTVPETAIFSQNGRMYVYKVTDDKVQRTQVVLGLRLGTDVVISSGLAEGLEIVTEGHQKLRDGASIKRQS